MSKTNDYNELFTDFQKKCDAENVCNVFSCITLNELEKLNYLLDRVVLFCDNVDEDEVEDLECGEYILELGKLADTLFTKDLRKEG